jgi:hypothetical protein
MKRVVYIAAGAVETAAAELTRLCLAAGPDSLRVVAPAAMARKLEQLASLRPGQLLAYNPSSALLLWLRLWMFLGLSGEAEIICLQSPHRFRSLKLLAFSLRGRLRFSDGKESLPSCSRFRLLALSLGRVVAGNGPVCVVASASPDCMRTIFAGVRQRYPGARLHGLALASLDGDVLGMFDSCDRLDRPSLSAYFRLLPRCFGKGRFQAVVLPGTNEEDSGLRWLAWWLPVWRVEIYNENGDAFSGRNLFLLVCHAWWRMRQQSTRRREQRERRRRLLPVGVVGSASGYYLKRIIPVVRASYPEAARLHALLPAELEGPTAGLFDSTTILKPGFGKALWQAWRVSRGGQPFQCWIVPCTNEPCRRMKLLAFLAPLARRQIYNDLGDGFGVRNMRTFYRHLAWRMRDHLSFQIVAATPGKNPALRLMHLLLYAFRLASAAPLLWKACLGSSPLRRRVEHSTGLRGRRPSVDLVYLESGKAEQSALELPYFPVNGGGMRLALRARGPGRIDEINAAIRNSQAEFICLMDSRCRMPREDWLDRLLETFDERTAQVGPQIVSSSNSTLIRGLLLDVEGAARWNSDSGVCWRGRPEWLAVDALPWVCVLFRRSVFRQMGDFRDSGHQEPAAVDLDFCRRLAAHGWHSICNQSVTAIQPMSNTASEAEEPAVGVSPGLRISEDGR